MRNETVCGSFHLQHDAFLFVKGNIDRSAIPEKPSVFDIVKILDADCADTAFFYVHLRTQIKEKRLKTLTQIAQIKRRLKIKKN